MVDKWTPRLNTATQVMVSEACELETDPTEIDPHLSPSSLSLISLPHLPHLSDVCVLGAHRTETGERRALIKATCAGERLTLKGLAHDKPRLLIRTPALIFACRLCRLCRRVIRGRC